MEPVELQESYPVTEVFAEEVGQFDAGIEALEKTWSFHLKVGKIDLSESVADKYPVNIPLKVLTQKKRLDKVLLKAMIGKSYPEEYCRLLIKKEENSPSSYYSMFVWRSKNKLEIAFDKF